MSQVYSVEDDRDHIRWLAGAFSDRRYIRVDGKPLFLVYRSARLPDPKRTTDTWREEAHRLGIGELALARVESFSDCRDVEPKAEGFDVAVEFAPDHLRYGPRLRYHGRRWEWKRKLGLVSKAYGAHSVHDYSDLAAQAMARQLPSYEFFRCVTPMWDNSARRKAMATIFHGSTPEIYERWLSFVLEQAESQPPDRRVVFINAWNEWGEGNHLEPCLENGHRYLEATRRALLGSGSARVATVSAGHVGLA